MGRDSRGFAVCSFAHPTTDQFNCVRQAQARAQAQAQAVEDQQLQELSEEDSESE